MATITNAAAQTRSYEILHAALRMQTGRDAVKPLGVSQTIGKPGLNRGLAGTIEFLAEDWAAALWLLLALADPILLTEPALGMTAVEFTPIGEPTATAQPLAGRVAYWTVQIEVTA